MADNTRILPAREASLFADWSTLFKDRITVFVAMAAGVGGILASGGAEFARVVEAAFYIALTSASACALNQVFERDVDALMQRTQNRPIPAGRISITTAVVAAALTGLGGVLGLALRFNLLAALLSLSTLVAYVAVYTPLKRHTAFNTVIGAVPGAMPPLLGYVAIAGTPGVWGTGLFAMLFVWQFPHFFAIAWLYREDYSRAGMRMLPCEPNSEGLAGRQAFAYSLAMLPVGLIPLLEGAATLVYGVGATALGLCYVLAAFSFAREETRRSARRLMFTSLLYLPCLFAVALFDVLLLQI